MCGSYANNVFAASTVPGITATGRCPAPSYNGGGFGIFNSGNTTRGQTGRWQTVAPAGLELVGATASQFVSVGVNDGADYGGGFYWAGGGAGTNDQTPSTVGYHVRIPVELLRHAAGVREEQLLCPRAARRPDLLALRPGDERPGLQRAQRPLADDRLDQGNVAVRHVGRLAIRPLLALGEPQRAADRYHHVRAGRLDLASVRRAGDQPVRGHDSLRPGRGAADAQRERCGGRPGEPQQDGLHRQQHPDDLAQRSSRRAVDGRDAIRHGDGRRKPVRDRADRVHRRRRARRRRSPARAPKSR